MSSMPRAEYAHMFGPTVGDRVRLADTALFIEVEKDLTRHGEEVKFGGGKVIRDGMGQSQVPNADGAMDTVITNAVILDHWGVVKADVGLRNGHIAKIGKAGNPDVQDGVDIVIGPGTEIIAGEGKILTAGGFDSHIHFICPQQIEEALASGITTMLGHGRPLYMALYVALIVFFCFFYTAIVFNPVETADNLKKHGGFIPGIRTGERTAEYIDYVLTRITVVGAAYIAAVCLFPEVLISYAAVPFYFGGTSLLIVVSVTMDTVAQIQGHLLAHQYEGLVKKAKLRGGRRK